MTRRTTVFLLSLLLTFSAFCDDDIWEIKRNCAVCGREFRFAERGFRYRAKSEKILEDIKAGVFPPTQLYTNAGIWLLVCADCNKIPLRCELCELPVKENGVRTSDGRTFCAREAGSVVMDEDTAQDIFQSAREAAVDTVGDYFALKFPSVTVRVSDVLEVDSNDTMHTLAISKCTPSGTNLVHYVVVHTGLPKSRAFYACVHEYTHHWIWENEGKHHIEPNTVEGLCELVAYKVAEARGDAKAQRVILNNRYTQGRVNQLVEYATQEDLSNILAWVKDGTSEILTAGLATATEESLKPVEVPLDVQISLAQSARPRPQNETLTINGTIKGAKGTLILLNGGLILGKGESGVVNLNGKSSKIRCVDIGSDTATFQYENSADVIKLSLLKH